MTNIPEVSLMLQTMLTKTANQLAHKTQFITRRRKVTGSSIVQTLLFSHLAHPMATYRQIHQTSVTLGQDVSMQALDKRLNTAEAVDFLSEMVNYAMTQVVEGENTIPILPNFQGVYITDGSIIRFGDKQRKLGAMLDLQSGTLKLCLTDANQHDQKLANLLPKAQSGQLHLRDLGFFKLATFQRWNQTSVLWLSRHKSRVKLYRASDGHEMTLQDLPRNQAFCVAVKVGHCRINAYLVGQSTPSDALAKRQKRLHRQAQLEQAPISELRQQLSTWTLYLTNIPDLTFEQAHTLARLRWQIELLFKLWKHNGCIEKSRSKLPLRNACLSYCKLLAVIVQHWILIVTGWHDAQQSWVYNSGLLRSEIVGLQTALPHVSAIERFLARLMRYFQRAMGVSRRAKNPSMFQLLEKCASLSP